MALIADGLLIAGALVAAIYCHVLARRLRGLRDLDAGLGGAIATLSRQVDEMRRTLDGAREVSGESVRELAERTARAEVAAGRLELLLATLHERDAAPREVVPDPVRQAATPTREPAPEAKREPTPDREDDPRVAVEALRSELAQLMRVVAGGRN